MNDNDFVNPIEPECLQRYTADAVVEEITEQECENLQAYTGLDGNQRGDCDDLAQLICDIKQEVDRINVNEVMTIFANDASKCADDDLPTLASMFSRVLRYVQAATCVLCAYDPRVGAILRQGRFPQMLVGSLTEGGYPQWIEPDTELTDSSDRPVTSAGIYTAIREAVLSVWHHWEEYPEFDYFAQTINDDADIYNLTLQTAEYPPENGDTALVASADGKTSLLYTYDGSWKLTKQLTDKDGLTNFAVTHINKGYYSTNGVYYFDETWQVMDTDISGLEARAKKLEAIYNRAVVAPTGEKYLITTAETLEAAENVPCAEGKTTIVFVTG